MQDLICGFRRLSSEELPEISAVLHRFVYEKNGAQLIWLERDDDNKTFAIAFKTIPSDDTGVFHILEHSVLCGSEHYPVKEPFVDLIKSSLATFLNAFTFPDKTMYPVCSRNDRDFLNLMDVYLDAVFHPLSAKSELAFRQEGWHYELPDGENGPLLLNGVVYNEMKGAYTDPMTIAEARLNALLFPDNCYGFESGGHPAHIPELTYESYLENYHRFYSASNSRIILDGKIDVELVFGKLDSFLSPFEAIQVNADIPFQHPVSPDEDTAYYEIGPQEDPAAKAILARGWVLCPFDKPVESMAFSVLSEYLCGSNDAPLTKALLDAGLCDDVSLNKLDSMQQICAQLVLENVRPENKEAVWSLVEKTLRQQAAGLDKKRLSSILSRQEFLLREKDFGRMPKGLVYAISTLDTWLYDGDPKQGLIFDEVFRSLRSMAQENGFERLLEQMLLQNPHRASLVLLPSSTLGQETAQAEAERLAAVKASWDEETIRVVREDFARLRQFQDREDSPEQKASLPHLSPQDVPSHRTIIPQTVCQLDGKTLLHHPIDTDEIVYLDLYFDQPDLPDDQVEPLSFLAELLGKLPTASYDVAELNARLQESLGRFTVSAAVRDDGESGPRPCLLVGVALLESKKQEAVGLIREILGSTRFTDRQLVLPLLKQHRMSLEQSFMMAGNAGALLHARASLSLKAALSERMDGIAQLRWLQAREKSCDEAFLEGLQKLAGRVFCRDRVLLSLTGKKDEAWLRQILAALPDGEIGPDSAFSPAAPSAEGFSIASEIGFAARAGKLPGDGRSGAALVASQLLTYDYLWNMVRVKGGAYGTSMRVDREGFISATSYRDPQPSRSLDTFLAIGGALKAFAQHPEGIENFIISTIGDLDPLLSPRAAGRLAATLWLAGVTQEDLQREWEQVLSTSPEDLAALAKELDESFAASTLCVIGSKPCLDACGDKLEAILPLQVD